MQSNVDTVLGFETYINVSKAELPTNLAALTDLDPNLNGGN